MGHTTSAIDASPADGAAALSGPRYLLAAVTDIGLVREVNEDTYALCPGLPSATWLYASGAPVEVEAEGEAILLVADGMGGAAAGDVASRLSIESIASALSPEENRAEPRPTVAEPYQTVSEPYPTVAKPWQNRVQPWLNRVQPCPTVAEPCPTVAKPCPTVAEPYKTVSEPCPTVAEPYKTVAKPCPTVAKPCPTVAQRLTDAIAIADKRLKAHAVEHFETAGMGTTIVAAWLRGMEATVAWCGDSRCYLYRPGEGLRRLTRDHSLVQRLIDSGQLTPDEALTHPDSNIITDCLGDTDEPARPDTTTAALLPGDLLLLCSDGLCGYLADSSIEAIVAANHSKPSACREALLAAALTQGGHDNITIAIARVAPVATPTLRSRLKGMLFRKA